MHLTHLTELVVTSLVGPAPAHPAEILALEGAWRDARARGDTAVLEPSYVPEARIEDMGGRVVAREHDTARVPEATLVPNS